MKSKNILTAKGRKETKFAKTNYFEHWSPPFRQTGVNVLQLPLK